MSSRRLGPLEITLIVVDAILIGVLVVLLVTAPDGPDDRTGDDPSSTAATTDPSATVTEDPTSAQVVTVPADAVDLAEFATPSGNIWCTIGDDSAACQIDTIEYAPPQIEGCDDNDLLGRVLVVGPDGAEFPCPDGSIPGADPDDREVLDYGQTTHVGDYMCEVTRTGVTCTNITTGSGFSVRRAEATRF